jgi:hypothetical protein
MQLIVPGSFLGTGIGKRCAWRRGEGKQDILAKAGRREYVRNRVGFNARACQQNIQRRR